MSTSTVYAAPVSNSTDIIFVRHARSTANAAGVWQGQLDYPLSREGIQQARTLGLLLSKAEPGISAIYSSPLSRAFQTAQLISEALTESSPPIPLPGLIERHGGLLEGTTAPEREERYPKLMQKFVTETGESRWPIVNAEPEDKLLRRFQEAVEYMLHSHPPGSTIIAVTHGGSLKAFLRTLLPEQRSPILDQRNILPNTSLTRIRWDTPKTSPALLELGATPHLHQ